MYRVRGQGKLGRREFLFSTGVLGVTGGKVFCGEPNGAAAGEQPFLEGRGEKLALVDTNVYLFQWPFRRLPDDTTQKLVQSLRSYGVVEAWAGSFEGIFHANMMAVNRRVVEECTRWPNFLRPCGTVHLGLPDWEEDFRRCVEEWHVKVIRLFPNYHGYSLEVPEVEALAEMASHHRVVLQLAVELEDQRTQPRLFRVPPVDLAPLERIVGKFPELRIMLLNVHRAYNPAQLRRWMEAGQVFVELTLLEGVGGIERLLEVVPVERVCFGSFFPMFYFAAAKLKLFESRLPANVLTEIASENAVRVLR